jgi:uncharacterized membrane protein
MEKIQITNLDNIIIIKKPSDSQFFITADNSIIIPMFNLSAILKFMLIRKLMSPKVLEGVLSDYYTSTDE